MMLECHQSLLHYNFHEPGTRIQGCLIRSPGTSNPFGGDCGTMMAQFPTVPRLLTRCLFSFLTLPRERPCLSCSDPVTCAALYQLVHAAFLLVQPNFLLSIYFPVLFTVTSSPRDTKPEGGTHRGPPYPAQRNNKAFISSLKPYILKDG